MLLRVFLTDLANALNVINKRNVTFRKIGRLSWPIVHLKVDVRVIVAGPGRLIAVIPDTLKIGRQRTRTRTTDKEITAKLAEQGLKFRISCMVFGIVLQTFQCTPGKQLRSSSPQIERKTVEQGLVIFHVLRHKCLHAPFGRRIDPFCYSSMWMFT